MKVCPKCGKEKENSKFHKNKNAKNGLQCYCKECVKIYMRERRRINKKISRLKRSERRKLLLEEDMFICSTCHETKSIEEFHKNSSTKNGLNYTCKKCWEKISRKDPEEYDDRHVHKLEQQELMKEGLKKCNNCKKVKSLDDFRFRKSKGCYDSICKKCKKKKDSERIKDKNKKKRKEINKLFSSGFFICKKCKKKKPVDEFYKDKNQKYGIETKCKKCRHKMQNKRRQNLKWKISNAISNRMRYSLKNGKNGYHWKDLVGYSLEKLKVHLESQFEEGMTWDNYGKWHIDHKIPISFFDFRSYEDEEFKICWNLRNLQPMWACKNISKSNKILSKKLLMEVFTNDQA